MSGRHDDLASARFTLVPSTADGEPAEMTTTPAPAYRTTATERRQFALSLNAMRARRIMLGLSQDDLAARLGVTRTFISGIERGVVALPLVRATQLAELLGVDPQKLMPLVRLQMRQQVFHHGSREPT
jgi:DNA-binding XRE family transcriptional regulator